MLSLSCSEYGALHAASTPGSPFWWPPPKWMAKLLPCHPTVYCSTHLSLCSSWHWVLTWDSHPSRWTKMHGSAQQLQLHHETHPYIYTLSPMIADLLIIFLLASHHTVMTNHSSSSMGSLITVYRICIHKQLKIALITLKFWSHCSSFHTLLMNVLCYCEDPWYTQGHCGSHSCACPGTSAVISPMCPVLLYTLSSDGLCPFSSETGTAGPVCTV